MPARRRDQPAQRWPREQSPDEDADQDGQGEDGAPAPDEPGEPAPAVPPPGQQGYSPRLPPLGEAMSEAREADGEVAAEQLARPSSALAGVRAHLARLMAALEKLNKPPDDE